MTDFYNLESRIEQMIDDLQGLCSTVGLSNSANEEVVITNVFLYKFLNDKFMYNLKLFSEEMEISVPDLLENRDSMLDAFYDAHPNDVAFKLEDTIETLSSMATKADFGKTFDDALTRISDYPSNDKFKVETTEGVKTPLFSRVTETVEPGKRDNFAQNIFSIITKDKFDFTGAYTGDNSFDFYSSIFEHLIKNYNVASGTYAEYFTPQSVSSIIAHCLVKMSDVDADKLYEIYDAAAGSGSLVLHLANELGEGKFGNVARVYTQDISQKSSRFLRINMMLNGLTESLDNIVNGDTLLTPAQYNINHDPSSGFKKFDYITINPPFKTDFSATRDEIESKWQDTDRFFAGVPKIPNAKKSSMSIYLMFMQHVLWSLKDDGKAAIVCPTGFITAQSGIEMKIRQKLIENNWLQGVISMPSNIFANTGTNVSVIFIDKAKTDNKVVLIDASKLGEKRKEGKNQRTVLRPDEIELIENTFVNREQIDDFSVVIDNTADEEGNTPVEKKNYSFSAGQYFEVKIEHMDITFEQFNADMQGFNERLNAYFQKGKELEEEIKKQMKGLIV